MGQTRTLGERATSVWRDTDGTLHVRYHATEVVRVDPSGVVHLNTGGWKTSTTKTRMNQAANQYGLGFYVYQRDYNWFVTISRGDGGVTPASTVPFDHDYLAFNPKSGDVLPL